MLEFPDSDEVNSTGAPSNLGREQTNLRFLFTA